MGMVCTRAFQALLGTHGWPQACTKINHKNFLLCGTARLGVFFSSYHSYSVSWFDVNKFGVWFAGHDLTISQVFLGWEKERTDAHQPQGKRQAGNRDVGTQLSHGYFTRLSARHGPWAGQQGCPGKGAANPDSEAHEKAQPVPATACENQETRCWGRKEGAISTKAADTNLALFWSLPQHTVISLVLSKLRFNTWNASTLQKYPDTERKTLDESPEIQAEEFENAF